MAELVSIVVPVYNAEQFLEKCIFSLIGQTYSTLEIILVDDGSADKSYDVCREFAAVDPRISVFHHTNSGPSATRNVGITNAHGQYLMFVDADDWLESTAVADMVFAIKKEKADLVIGGYERFVDVNDQNNSMHLLTQEPLRILDGATGIAELFMQPRTSLAGVSVWAKLYRANLIRTYQIKFCENVSYEEDCRFNLQYYRHIKRTAVIGSCIYHYRQTEMSLSNVYCPENFAFLLGGYYERRRFFEEIGLEAQLPKLESIMLIVMLSVCKKIALSSMRNDEKYSAYSAIIKEDEIQRIVHAARAPEGKLVNAVVCAVKRRWTTVVAFLMYLWRWSQIFKIRKKRKIK